MILMEVRVLVHPQLGLRFGAALPGPLFSPEKKHVLGALQTRNVFLQFYLKQTVHNMKLNIFDRRKFKGYVLWLTGG